MQTSPLGPLCVLVVTRVEKPAGVVIYSVFLFLMQTINQWQSEELVFSPAPHAAPRMQQYPFDRRGL